MIRTAAALAMASALGAAGAHAQAVFADQSYSEAEAGRGQGAFGGNCSTCHGADLSAGPFGPALKGDDFARHWRGQGAQALLAYIETRMPPAAPGSLPSQTYADIAAYILKANGAAGVRGSTPVPGVAEVPRPATRAVPPTPLDARAAAALAARKAKLAALTPVSDAMLARPPEGDWLIWRRTYDAAGFSNLKQVGKVNVAALRQVWSWTLPVSQNETTPLVHDGVLFIASGNAVQALDAATGDLLWQYVRPLRAELNDGRTSRTKALAIYKDRLFVPTADKHLIALDMHTGALIWDVAVAGAPGADRNGVPQVSGAPIVARGKVVIGVSLGVTSPGGCFIVAFDADSGKEAWRFNTVDQRPAGQDSWNGAPVNERFGAGVWTSGSYDPQQNLLFFGVGNTYSAGTLLLPKAVKGASNDALYTDSTLALDPDSGKLVWH
jgi:alcohol dehydrogenase (cytochrome c)